MQIGSLIIANDLLGFLTADDGVMATVKDKDDNYHRVRSASCAEIISPYALAYLTLKKAKERVQRGKKESSNK